MAMDANDGSPDARAYLQKHTYLQTYWQTHHTLPEGFSPAGYPLGTSLSGFTLSAALAQNHILHPVTDHQMYVALLGQGYAAEGYWFNHHKDFLHSVIWLHLVTLSQK